mgnify:CR=1 FL=1
MYQFYYADESKTWNHKPYKENMRSRFQITAIRPTMWEEHCLECSAPLCYQNCLHYAARSDGRCKRFDNGFLTFQNDKACCGQGVHIKFRKWANMMTIIFPSMMPLDTYRDLFEKNQKLGNRLKKIVDSKLPTNVRWLMIRTEEYLRRRKLRSMMTEDRIPDAFVFHGFSYHAEPYNLMIEIYDDHTPLYKTSLPIAPGENIFVLNREQMSAECWTANNLVKVYPENNLEVELDILWCDFVQGKAVVSEKPAAQVKCVVWDLDNTLWNGTLIETEKPENLQLNEGVLETIRELDRRGIIQSVASKNDMNVAWPVLEKLELAEYFLYPQIHWNAKSGSMEQIAKCFNIGIDTLALIDDSGFEREQVRSVWPQVRVYDAAELPDLLDKAEFTVTITEESKNRRAMYRAEEKRNQLMVDGNEDTIAFLKKCNLQIDIFAPRTDSEILRCYELIVRTNQLNMSGKKYSQKEFDDVLNRAGHRNFAFSCKDDFGEYGIVGFGQYRVERESLIFTEFAMSCRVAGKYVESALFAFLLKMENCQSGKFEISITKKNSLLRNTLKEIGFSIEQESINRLQYQFGDKLLHSELVKVERRR